MRKTFNLSIYFVADPSLCQGRDIVDIVARAVDGGVTMVQLRNKSGNILEFLEQAHKLRSFLKARNIPFIINDRPDVAKEMDADGVHLGQDDMPAREARKLLGPQKIIGVTAFREEHFKNIDADLVDYAGTGPFYQTRTDKGKPVLGPAEFRKLVKISPVPVVGIGGITPENAKPVIECGAAGVAMMRAISESNNPEMVAKAFADVISPAGLRKRVHA